VTTTPTTGARATAPKRAGLTRPRTGAAAFDNRPRWKPRREELIDAAALALLGALAGYGLTTVYDGYGVVLVALVGAVAGVAAGWVVAAAGLSPVVGLAVMVGALFVGAGVAVPDHALVGLGPGPGTPGAFADGLVHSWRDLLTTAAPVGLGGGLGVVPYVLGFVGGGGGMLLARLTRSPLLPAAPSLVALVASILFGNLEPVSVLVQGGGYLIIALAWGAWRSNRAIGASTDGIYWPRVWGSVAMLGVLVPVGLVAGPRLPLVDDGRVVLRQEIVPPFDAADYGSPLATIRRYRTAEEDNKRTYLSVTGLPKGALVRIATMDRYDGVVWTVSGDDRSGSGRFKRVGARVEREPEGTTATIDVTVAAFDGVWVPTVGSLRSIGFSGSNRERLEKTFRYNSTTGTAAAIDELRSGDRYRLDVVLPDASREGLETAETGSLFEAYDPELGDRLNELVKPIEGDLPSTGTPFQRAAALEAFFSRPADTTGSEHWYFSDGGRDATGLSDVPAGHSLGRLTDLMRYRVGNAEQYAAAMALIAHRMGMPARVVMGFKPDDSGTVDLVGDDVTAWVEIEFQGRGWVPFFPTPPKENTPKPAPQPQDPAVREQQPMPPPTYLEPPAPNPPLNQDPAEEDDDVDDSAKLSVGLPPLLVAVLTYVGLPLLLIGGVLAAVLLLKSLRTRRRRNSGTPVERLNGAWLEAVDRLRDRGFRPTAGATRREVSLAAADGLGWSTGPGFATAVDGYMFGPDDPDEHIVRTAWSQLDQEVRAINEPLTRRQRARARLSLASLRRVRPTRPASLPGDATQAH
jgi:hypothetical protein